MWKIKDGIILSSVAVVLFMMKLGKQIFGNLLSAFLVRFLYTTEHAKSALFTVGLYSKLYLIMLNRVLLLSIFCSTVGVYLDGIFVHTILCMS